MTYVFVFLPGAAGHPRFADTRNAAVTLTPSPRPMVGDFFCLPTNPNTVIARSPKGDDAISFISYIYGIASSSAYGIVLAMTYFTCWLKVNPITINHIWIPDRFD
jgi:hypothetical protein